MRTKLVALLVGVFMTAVGTVSAMEPNKVEANLTFYGQAAFSMETASERILIDPYISTNPWKATTGLDMSDINQVNLILVTHGHNDHIGDAVAISQRDSAPILAIAELGTMLKERGALTTPMSIGGKRKFDFGSVKMTLAIHGSGVPGGLATGFVVDYHGTKIYHAGDTALFKDMEFIGEEGLDYALLPIGDNYTMGIDDAVKAVEMLKPKYVIPMHYDTNPYIKQDPMVFKNAVEKRYPGVKVIIMKPGETIKL